MKLRRKIAVALGLPIAAVALVGFAHTPAGRPLLARLGGARVGCPVSTANASPQQIEAQRAATMKAMRGAEQARARPALGFVLARTTKVEVAAWASARGSACSEELAKTALRCPDVPLEGGAVRDLFARFDPSGALVGVDAIREAPSGDAAIALVDSIAAALVRDVGAASATRGETTGAALEAETYASRAFEFRFRDYSADVSATNFGEGGIVVREQYRFIPGE